LMVCRKRRLCLLLYSTRRDAPFSGQASDPDRYSFCAERTFSPQAKESATDSAFGNEEAKSGGRFSGHTQKPRGLTDEPFLFDGGQAATPLQKSGRTAASKQSLLMPRSRKSSRSSRRRRSLWAGRHGRPCQVSALRVCCPRPRRLRALCHRLGHPVIGLRSTATRVTSFVCGQLTRHARVLHRGQAPNGRRLRLTHRWSVQASHRSRRPWKSTGATRIRWRVDGR
jgi:hypothetical protein